MKKFWNKYRFVILLITIWRLVLWVGAWASKYVPIYSPTYLGVNHWANTDGINYVRIAQWGYGHLDEAFFPVYPFLLRFIHMVIPLPYETIGIIVSTTCFIIACLVLYAMISKKSVSQARWLIAYIVSFPTASFFTAVYTESLFLLLFTLVIYFSSKQKWLLAGICVSIASATRIVGICMAVIVLYELWKSKQRIRLLDMVGIISMPVGLLTYMLFLLTTYHDPLRFIHIQALYEINRTGGAIILLPQVIWRYLKIFVLAVGKPTIVSYGVSIIEFILTMGAVYFIYYGWKKRLKVSYVLYSVTVLLIPTLTGTFMSMPRYILTIIPLFITLTYIQRNLVKYIIISIFSTLQIVLVMLYLRGWFIA